MAVGLGKKLWEASESKKQASQMMAFARFVSDFYQKDLNNWQSLYQWSIDELEEFWLALASFGEIKWHEKAYRVLNSPFDDPIKGAKWFMGARLNFAENLLANLHADAVVLVGLSENKSRDEYTGAQLKKAVFACAHALKKLGVKKGDRAAGFVSNACEAVVAMLASTSLGAIWTSCSPDFGADAVIDRFGQISPKVVFFTREYSYNDKLIDCAPTIKECIKRLSEETHAIIIGPDNYEGQSLGQNFGECINQNATSETSNSQFEFASMDFDDPLYILYSSGTTGTPKAIVHGVGGTLLQHKKELMLHGDLKKGDTLMYFTTCGWMMWNWMVSALSVGVKLVVFDGSPAYPSLEKLWDVLEEERVTAFGTSPKYLGSCMNLEMDPGKSHDLSCLQTIFSTGSPLLPEHCEWVYSKVKKDVHLASISGGTDIISCFMLGNPILPVYTGEIQSPGLGMDIQAWDDEGQALTEHKAELVCKSPFVSRPIYFFGDETGEKYQNAYFNYYKEKNVWRHGDYIEVSKRGGIVVYGRSDATLNPGGVRIGTSEIYRQTEQMNEIADSIAAGIQKDGDVDILLFVCLSASVKLDDALTQTIKERIRKGLSPRHVPKKIIQVDEIPYTRSGKKVELAITRILQNQAVENLGALVNPDSLEQYHQVAKSLSGS